MTTADHRFAPGAIAVVVGTRPEAIKLAPVILALRELGIVPLVCLTGQHAVLAAEALGQFAIAGDRTLSLMPAGQPLSAANERAARGDIVLRIHPSNPREAFAPLAAEPAVRLVAPMAQASTRIGDGNAGLRIVRRLQRELAVPRARCGLIPCQSSAGFD